MRDAFMAEIDLPAGIVLSESHFCLGTFSNLIIFPLAFYFIYLKEYGDVIHRQAKSQINITLLVFKINVSVHCCRRKSGGPSTEHCHIVTHQEDPKPLSEMPDYLFIELSNISGQLPAKPGNNFQGFWVPAS